MKSKNIYKVPISKKDITMVISDSRVHSGVLGNSVDFLIPIGTKIHAAQDGEVIIVKTDSDEGVLKKNMMMKNSLI